MSHHIVETNSLGYRYPDGTRALRGVSFRITHGESVAIVGANGAGKSTLLHHLCAAVLPEEGEVRIGDFPVTRKRLDEVRRTVGMVFQNSDDQLFMPTVFDDVAFGPVNSGLPEREIEERVNRVLERVGAAHLRDRSASRISAGEKRAVAIASVLSCLPDILLLDEPAADLDPRARRRVIELLDSFEHTKIIATHDLDLVLEVCERTIVLAGGEVKADGDSREIFSDLELLAGNNLEQPFSMKNCPVCGEKKKG